MNNHSDTIMIPKPKKPSATPALDAIASVLAAKARKPHKKGRYAIPSLWLRSTGSPKAISVDPYKFYLGIVRTAKKQKAPRVSKAAADSASGGEWSKDAVIYNMFVRTTTAFDHNGNGRLDLPLNKSGFRETGTFLKAIAILPYIKRLGATVIHLLPVTSIGQDGNKGALGSPYAIRNPYELDENLSEPALGLDVKTEFKAFIEAAHGLGLRVVAEFVFRTAAKDADWIKAHPEWFYWIKEEIPLRHGGEADEGKYGSPLFSHDELQRIHDAVNSGRFGELPPPHQQYRDFFTSPPEPYSVRSVKGRYLGTLPNGQKVKIPGAFADWPPDDNQPPWNDVTYLKLYHHHDFNYIGYNTIRMYDTRLAHAENINRPLWDKIIGIIPYYQKDFGIDGVMIDMGHALPMDLKHAVVKTARDLNPDFAFWDENFSIDQRSRHEGYNAVFGYLWHIQHVPQYMKEFLHRLERERMPIPFFATAENHNTHRAASRQGGTAFSKWAFVINMFLPAIPFLHSGFEIGEEFPINTGLDFSGQELQKMPSESLPLFSQFEYNWLRKTQFTSMVTRVLKVRQKYLAMITNSDPSTFRVLHSPNEAIVAFTRIAHDSGRHLAVITNGDTQNVQAFEIKLETGKSNAADLIGGKRLKITGGVLRSTLGPGESFVVEY